MGLSSLGAKNVRKIERRIKRPVEWASVNCSGDSKYYWRFWVKEGAEFRLGVWNLREDTWEMTDNKQEVLPQILRICFAAGMTNKGSQRAVIHFLGIYLTPEYVRSERNGIRQIIRLNWNAYLTREVQEFQLKLASLGGDNQPLEGGRLG